MQACEGLIELVQRRLLAHEGVHVVDQEQVGLAVAGPECGACAIADRRRELAEELLAGDEQDGLPVAVRLVGDGVQQVGFAHAAVADR